ncbi:MULTISPECIES: rhodanese-like domain-containing protein [Geobacter]|uniref:Sulfurtransferase n=2 Tax=Geobacter TaxID=28231 RepID=A0A0C1TQK9_9BACT|nr:MULTISPECIES: rhodanese-like domain-containing protein [Geobacter]ANA40944.1 sulfurtransferase [Geobacter anodireducens]KIE43049.1 sulfurtransferase [Geobacter soli]MBE2886918.1 sulfurtransferase [Geobacter anodireducens]HMN02601.1 rhodanese-like domain-containing protein [Geobacter anodireducens]
MMDELGISADEVKSRMKSGEELFFVNLQHHQDWDLAVMKVRGALRVPDDRLEQHFAEIPRDRPLIVYSTCPGDEPSLRAARFLQQHGWNDVHFLIGGFNTYCEAGLPVEDVGTGSTSKKLRGL